MKKILLSASLSLLLLLLFTHPAELSAGCTNGLLLWYSSVLPSLLPFFIFSNLLIRSELFQDLNRIYAPLLRRIFRISDAGCYGVLVGFLCGFPTGAKVIGDLVKENQITVEEGNYLLGFCNNVSPAFFINYLCMDQLHCAFVPWRTVGFFYCLPVFYGLISRPFFHFPVRAEKKQASSHRITFPMLDACIMDSFFTVTRLGGYIMLFSILLEYLKVYVPDQKLFLALGSVLEISSGIRLLASSSLIPDLLRLPLLLMCCSFGGLCILAQTSSVLEHTGLSVLYWLRGRIMLVLLTVLPALPLLLHRLLSEGQVLHGLH